MSDIELVIKIPEEIYKNIQSKSTEIQAEGYTVENAILNGTPLPKHGRLFDENELKKEAIRREWSRNMYDTLDHTLSYMKPTIEADKEL